MDAIPSTPLDSTTPCQGLAIRPWEGLLLGLLAGAIVSCIIQAKHPIFHVPEEFHIAMGAALDDVMANRREQDRVDRNHAALYLGGLGLLVAAALGLREAAARRSWLPPIIASPLGAAGGALGGMLGCMVVQHVRTNIGQALLTHTVATQLAVALPLSLGVGLGLGLATRTVRGTLKTALAGLAAGTLAAIVFPVAVSVLLPAASTEALLPEETSARLLWLGLLSGLTGLVIPVASRQRASANHKPAPATL